MPRPSASRPQAGDSLPPWIVEITTSMVIAGALFNRDPQDVHHDRDITQGRGFQDIFMNTMTTTGLVTRYINDWAGPEAVVKTFRFRLGRPNYPNDEMRVTGTVKTVEEAPEGLVATLEINGDNSLGHHISCEVCIAVPTPTQA